MKSGGERQYQRGTSEKLEPREREDLLFCNLEEREKYFA